MEKKYQTFSLLAVFFSLWLPLLTGYFYYDSLSEVDFLSPSLIFENPDQEYMPAEQQKGKAVLMGGDSLGFFGGSSLLEAHLLSSPPIISPFTVSAPLRC